MTKPMVDLDMIGEVKPNYRRAVMLRIDAPTAQISADMTFKYMKELCKRFKRVGHCENCGYEHLFEEARYCPNCGEGV